MRSLQVNIVLTWIITVTVKFNASTVVTLNGSTSCVQVDDNLLFTCVANHTSFLAWFVDPVISRERPLIFSSDDEIGASFNKKGFTATLVYNTHNLIDSRYVDLVSTLAGTASSELSNGSRVWCSAGVIGSDTNDIFEEIVIKELPSSPNSLTYTVLDSDLQNSILSIQWNIENDTEVEEFLISVYSENINYTDHSNKTMVILTLPYNENYTISVKAVNCVGEGKADISLDIIGCDHSKPPENGTIKPYYSLAEGSEISYHCNTGYAPHEEMTAVCTHQGVWTHNPNELECLRDCGAPHPPLNGYVEPYNSTVEGGEVFYQCKKGYSPSDVRMRAVCTAEGVWNPNPAHLPCRVDCGVPVVPNDGSIEPYSNRTSVGAVVYYHCNPGYYPEGKKEAVCFDDGVWRPSPADLTCSKMGKQLVFIISAAIAGSILCVFLLGSLLLYWKKRHQGTKSAINETPPAMASDPLYEEISTQVGEEIFALKENAAYGPRPKVF